ncbi:response regulator [Micromonospora auratinigra]|uniref:Two component transcriptional regulator, LuxR family n=1 Tax=Micromonospora auratinigra TaxID=261654 RepID=A0A1A8ZGB0_9ACTN|nr:response regulator transcription factor [Micromonospora auratinigra]SBT42874.1 two component transcriptional regulator, LuxR family [Micromonospora auratinigra]
MPELESERPIRVLLVDDHALLRDGLREMMECEEDIVVVGEAGSGAEALAVAPRLEPDLIVLDVEIPGEDVAETVRRLRAEVPQTRILILSMHDDPVVVQNLLGLGISGYLLKSIRRQDFLAAMRSAHQSGKRVVLSISRSSLDQLNSPNHSLLSSREQEIINLVARAMSNAQIASQLYITEGTVKRHLRNIFMKLGAVSRIDAVNKAAVARHRRP